MIPKRNCFRRWILVQAQNESLAWSGSEWVRVSPEGLPIAIQVCNFETEEQAREYAARVQK